MSGVRTLMGAYLVSFALRDADAHDRYRADLSRTRWVDADEVTHAALRLTVRRCLGPEPGFVAIGRAAVLTSRMFPRGDVVAVDVERIIRICLGQDEEDLTMFRLRNPELLRTLTFAALVRLHAVPASEVTMIVAQAEEDVLDIGYSPTRLAG